MMAPLQIAGYTSGMPPPSQRPAVIYKATNTINGHFYIGVTVDLAKRKALHLWTAKSNRGRAPLYRALRKYGPNAFEWAVIAEFETGADAVAEEVRLIKELRPHYNATPGGQGFNPTVMSPEGRARISAAHRGKQYRLGKPHTEETKRLLREHGLRTKDSWLARSHLGPKACRRPVICVETGKVYESAAAAGRAHGIASSVIAEVCNRNPRRRTAAGKVFRFQSDCEDREEAKIIALGPWRNGSNPYRGVHPHIIDGRDTGRWRARIRTGGRTGKYHSLGIFDTAEKALEAYLRAKAQIAAGTFSP